MNLVDLLHLEKLACFGVGLHLEDEIVKAGSRYAGHGAFSGGHGQREPDEQAATSTRMTVMAIGVYWNTP